MDSGAVSYADRENNSSESDEEDVSRSYSLLSFYMGSTVDYPGPISYMCPTVDHPGPICMSNYIPLSLFPLGSTAYSIDPIRMANEKNVRNYTIDKGRKSKVNNIPHKISISILSKLPVKSLKRFECVQKSWSILLENSDFMTMYTNHFISRHAYENSEYHTFLFLHHFKVSRTPGSRNHAQLYLLDSCNHDRIYSLENIVKFNLPPLFQQHCQCVSSILCSTSVNGIFCFGQIYRSKNEVQYVLWDPATEKFRVIPPSPNELRPHYPQNKHYLEHAFHGFGYDQVSNDYKLIQFVSFVCDSDDYNNNYDNDNDNDNDNDDDNDNDNDNDDYSPPTSSDFFEIYSLNTNSWRMIDMGIPLSHWAYPPSFAGEEVYVDGVCHWLCTRFISPQHIDIDITLLSFDLNHEAFITTPIGEESYSPYTFDKRLAVLNDSIALISNYHDDNVFHISILGELGVSESWIKLYIYGPLPSLKWPPIGFGKTGYLFFAKKDYQLAYVDLSTQIVKERGITHGKTSYFRLGLYKESLYSIGGSRI